VVNLLAPVILTQLALPSLRLQKGRVINITSGAAVSIIGGWGAYSTAKAALNQLTRILASEEPDVTNIALLPGIVDTEMQATIRQKGKNRMAEQNYARLSNLHATGRLLPPQTPGRAIVALALRAPAELSGEVLPWDDARVQQLVQQVFEK
jgi:NAD(P)-dependent dehydrogenase (short-subunit alcohol dehydrogenase family)